MADLRIAEIMDRYDVAVIGGGAGGLAAAVFARQAGASVLLVEKSELVGGTSALSAGTIWAPLTELGRQVNPEDSRDKVSAFLDHIIGNHGDKALREAFLDAAPEAIAALDGTGEMKLRPYEKHPDYEWDGPYATLNGRALEALPFDTRKLGKQREAIRPTLPEFTVLGGMNIDRVDIGNLLNRYKSLGSFLYVARIVTRYAIDRLRFGRHTRLVMGGALIGRLYATALELGVDVLRGTQIDGMAEVDGRVTGLSLSQESTRRSVSVSGGVIMATGGFARNEAMARAHLPAALPGPSPVPDVITGDLHEMVRALGGHYATTNEQPSFWAPCSTRPRADGSEAVYPHFAFDRSKPGTVCVDATGRRFANESLSYHRFGKAMLEGGEATRHAWIITDAPGIAKYGLGLVRPGGDKLTPYLADGYLKTGATLEELAQATGTDPAHLTASIAQINAAAARGEDPDFHRGSTPYQRHNGDATVGPNPTLGTVKTPPFYAVRLIPASIGTAKGFVTDTHARITREDGSAIDGLYATGNDMNSVMGGTYPGPGVTLGPAIVFGYIAARDAAGRAAARPDKTSG